MLSPTHICFGVLTGSFAISFHSHQPGISLGLNTLSGALLLSAVSGSVLPDIDNKAARISKILPFLNRLVNKRWSHRTVTYSFFGLGISSLIFYLGLLGLAWLTPLSRSQLDILAFVFGSAYFSHLILDTCTRTGVPFLYPLIKNRFAYPSVEHYRFITGDRWAEISISILSLLLFGLYLPVAQEGAQSSLRNAIGGFRQLRSNYMDAINQEVILDFEGYDESSKAPINGRGLILAEEGNLFVVLFDGEVHHIGEDDGNIRLITGQCLYLDSPPVITTVRVRNDSLAVIMADISRDVRISGELASNRTFDVRKPYKGTLQVSASSIEMSFANKEDLLSLDVRANADMSTEDLPDMQSILDSLIGLRQKTNDLYRRQLLFKEISKQRKEVDKLETLLKKQGRDPPELIFSGVLYLRSIPPF